MLTYDDLSGPELLGDNIAGGSKRWWFVRVADIETESTPEVLSPASTDPAALVNITVAHVLKTGKRMFEVYATENTSVLKTTVVGGKDSYGLKIEAEWFLPSSDETALGIAVMGKNDQVIGFFEHNDGKIIQIGSKRFPARLTSEYTSGELEAGGRGITFKMSAYGTTVAIYDAVPQTTPEA